MNINMNEEFDIGDLTDHIYDTKRDEIMMASIDNEERMEARQPITYNDWRNIIK